MTEDVPAVSDGLEDIDWAGLWHRQMDNASFRGQGADFWDKWGRTLPNKKEHSGYVEELMSRLRLKAEDSVLDVGSGTGAITIPMAKRVRSVTALDHSPVLLDIVSKNAAAEGLTNIQTLNLDWTKARIGADFQKHDVVVVSRSLPASNDVTKSLKMIDAAARRSCYVTWKARSYDEFEDKLSRMLNILYLPFPEHIVLYNLLHSIGISAEVDIFKTGGFRRYETLEEASLQIIRSQPVEQSQKQKILNLLADHFEYRNGAYYQPKNALWALMHWDKSE